MMFRKSFFHMMWIFVEHQKDNQRYPDIFIWVFFTCICDALIYIYLFNTSSELLSGWFILDYFIYIIDFFLLPIFLQQNKVQEFKHLIFFSVFLFDLRKLIWDWRLYHQFRIYDDAKCGWTHFFHFCYLAFYWVFHMF